MVRCKGCQGECIARESKTERNPGRLFWACKDGWKSGCKAWNGWLSDKEVRERDDASYGGGSSSSSEGESDSLERKTKKGAEIYTCERCDKVLDLAHETANHIKRYQSSGISYAFGLTQEIRDELHEAFKSGEYVCERCLGNEK